MDFGKTGAELTIEEPMDVYFQLITDGESLAKACAELESEKAIGFDTETTELDPFDGLIRLVQLSTTKKTFVIDLFAFKGKTDLSKAKALDPLRKLLAAKSPRKVAHNAKFDAKWVSHHLGAEVGGIFDTMLASQLISAGERDRGHGLADVSAFFLGKELDKSQQVSDWAADDLSPAQIEYAARDAAIMVSLQEKILERLRNDDLEKVAEIENGCVMPIAQMELNGFFLDEDRWREQLEKVKEEQAELAAELQQMLSAGVAQASLFGVAEINLDSQSQVSDALRNLGVPINDSTRQSELEPLAADYPVVAKLIEYRTAAKALSSFGENILGFVRPTGRIHSDFRQIGAPTGRFSSSNPNVQQIPHQDPYRRCFRAPSGRKLVIADYSQIELRILADFSEDRNFIRAFESGADFHAMTASEVFNVKIDEVTPEQRSFAKRLNFGVVYGIGASRFAAMTGLSQKQAEDTLRRYFATYSGLDAWLRNAARKAVTERSGRTGSGRMIKFRFEENDREAVAKIQRNAKNFPIQGTSADILKRALHLLHEGIRGTSARLVNIVHDEIIIECEEKETEHVARVLEESMLGAGREFLSKVPVKADVTIADEWAK